MFERKSDIIGPLVIGFVTGACGFPVTEVKGFIVFSCAMGLWFVVRPLINSYDRSDR